MPDRLSLFFIVIVSSLLLFYHLGKTSLVNWDEAMFASVAQDMVKRGDFLDGRMNGQVWVYEPPLLTWVLAIILKTVGPEAFWLRSFNAMCGIIIGLTTSLIAVSLSGKKLAGIFSFLILFSDIEFLFRARQINVEIPLMMFLLISLGGFIVARKSAHRGCFLIVSSIALGLAFLTKRASPVLALPAVSLLFFLDRKFSKKTVITFILLFLLVSTPWYIASYQKWGQKFLHEFFLDYTIGKIRSVNIGAGSSVLFYVGALRHALKFWMIPLPFALIWFLPRIKRYPAFAALGLFVATYFFALGKATIKSSWFLLPIHPILSLFIGIWAAEAFSSRKFWTVLAVLVISIIAVWQLKTYHNDFIVPDTTGRQVMIVRKAAALLRKDEPLFLDDDYLPVAVFYSAGRKVIALRFDRLGRPGNLPTIPPSGSLVLSNDETIELLRSHVQAALLPVSSVGDLKLLRVQPDK